MVPWARVGHDDLACARCRRGRRDTALMSSSAGELPVGAGGGLEGHGVHAGDLAEVLLPPCPAPAGMPSPMLRRAGRGCTPVKPGRAAISSSMLGDCTSWCRSPGGRTRQFTPWHLLDRAPYSGGRYPLSLISGRAGASSPAAGRRAARRWLRRRGAEWSQRRPGTLFSKISFILPAPPSQWPRPCPAPPWQTFSVAHHRMPSPPRGRPPRISACVQCRQNIRHARGRSVSKFVEKVAGIDAAPRRQWRTAPRPGSAALAMDCSASLRHARPAP